MLLHEMIQGTIEKSNADPVFERAYDLIVVGLGTAGAISLITAGRKGLSVLGVEQLYGMGGTATLGSICGYYYGAKGGVYEEIDAKASKLEETLFMERAWRESKLLVLEREAGACGAEIKYHCIVTGVYMEGNKVVGLRLFQEGRSVNVRGDKFIDATGEAVVCQIAGCECRVGREFDHQTQPFTFTNVAVDGNGYVFGINKDSGEVDQQDPREVSKAMIIANCFPMYLKEDYSKEEKKLVTMSALIGVREGRRIRGRKTLTLKDMVNGKMKEERPLFYTFSNVDNHGKNIVFEDEELCDWFVASGLWGVMLAVPVPLEALLPDGIENIMVAGRCLSVDHNLAAAVRMQRDMQKSGEAAAYVCCEAIRNNCLLSEVDYDRVAEKLKASKCLNQENNIGFRERTLDSFLGNELPELKTPDEVMERLASEKPGWGIWWAKIVSAENDMMVEKLKQGLSGNDEHLSRNSALALGLMNEKCALPKLRRMAGEPDNYIPKSSLKYVYTRGVSATYLLGKLKDSASIEMLLDIVARKGRTGLKDFVYNEFYCTDDDVYSQYIAFAVRALIDIAGAYADQKEYIEKTLLQILEDSDYEIKITLKNHSESLFDLKPKLMEYLKCR